MDTSNTDLPWEEPVKQCSKCKCTKGKVISYIDVNTIYDLNTGQVIKIDEIKSIRYSGVVLRCLNCNRILTQLKDRT